MAKRVLDLILTDMTFHAKHLRPASTLEKAAKHRTPEGLPHGRLAGSAPIPNNTGGYQSLIRLPDDLQAQLDRGEVEIHLWMPKDGLLAQMDRSTVEKIAQIEKKHTNMAIHRSRVWKSK